MWATFSGMRFALFPFLPGHPPPPELSPALRAEFARTIAAVHRATPALAGLLPPRETFEISFEAELRHGLAALERIESQARPGLEELRQMLLPRQAEILAQLERLCRLQQAVRRLSGPFVLCHTDIGGDNVLIDEQGQFYLLDWDDATVAPPEYDLQVARGEGFEHFLEVYKAAGGAQPLHLDHFAFYLLRRYLGDMTVRMSLILEENTSAEQDANALYGIKAYGFAQWAALDETLDGIATALRHGWGLK